jgi:KaiC/GvpD/RAD55 family RecA-like ATPase
VTRARINEKIDRAKGSNGTKRPIEILSFADMLEPDLENRELIKGLIGRGTTVMIYGEAGCGKTFLTLDLALNIAAGRNWFGMKTPLPGKVIYVAAEAGRSIKNRVAAWAMENEVDDVDFRAVVSPVDLCHPRGGDVDRLIEAIGGADVVIIDTVSRALAGGNENAPDDMGAFVTALDAMRDSLACTVIVVHHIGKDSSRGGRGHSLLHCAVDTEIEVERCDDISLARVTKQRDGPGGAEYGFRLKPVVLGMDEDHDVVTSCVVEREGIPDKKRVLGMRAQDALELLNRLMAQHGLMLDGEGWVEVAAWDEATKDLFRGNRMAKKRAKDELKAKGYVEFSPGDDRVRLIAQNAQMPDQLSPR